MNTIDFFFFGFFSSLNITTGNHGGSMRPRVLPVTRCRFSTAAADPSNHTQIYKSRLTDPYANLALEAHLLRQTAPSSRVLLLYTNAPSVILGRNQNAWTEASARHLRTQGIRLVRRASGGGAVFHDGGNLNYAVVGPRDAFDRAAHALLVVRALRRLRAAPDAALTPRHDIAIGADRLKVSGSAYKLTRLRALHHGTCLTSAADLAQLAAALRAPAAPFVVGRGVASVRSRVGAVGVEVDVLAEAIAREFAREYGPADLVLDVGACEMAALPDEVRDEWRKLRVSLGRGVGMPRGKKKMGLKYCVYSLQLGSTARHPSLRWLRILPPWIHEFGRPCRLRYYTTPPPPPTPSPSPSLFFWRSEKLTTPCGSHRLGLRCGFGAAL